MRSMREIKSLIFNSYEVFNYLSIVNFEDLKTNTCFQENGFKINELKSFLSIEPMVS
jgi:hypothetical protein